MIARLVWKLFFMGMIFVCAGCNSVKVVSGEEFQRIYEARDMSTMHHAEYLGHTEDRVCLSKKSMSLVDQTKWNEELICADISKLAPAFRNQLLSNSTRRENLKAADK